MTYEELLIKHPMPSVMELDLSEVSGLKGLYYNDSIAIERNMSQTEKSCVLAEELGHHYTTVGNILDQSQSGNRKQELHARLWAYNQKIGLSGLVKAYTHGCRSSHEAAEYLDVTEQFLQDAIDCYRNKYGSHVQIDNYLIFFEPALAVMKQLELVDKA